MRINLYKHILSQVGQIHSILRCMDSTIKIAPQSYLTLQDFDMLHSNHKTTPSHLFTGLDDSLSQPFPIFNRYMIIVNPKGQNILMVDADTCWAHPPEDIFIDDEYGMVFAAHLGKFGRLGCYSFMANKTACVRINSGLGKSYKLLLLVK